MVARSRNSGSISCPPLSSTHLLTGSISLINPTSKSSPAVPQVEPADTLLAKMGAISQTALNQTKYGRLALSEPRPYRQRAKQAQPGGEDSQPTTAHARRSG
jgi:hypothetical protein